MYTKLSALLTVCLLAAAAGCNLTLDVEEYPYRAAGDVDGQTDATVADAEPDAADTTDSADAADGTDGPDADSKPGEPHLIFTEVMPDVSTPPETSVELGEYIEVKNVGTAPADPRRIIIQLAGSNRRIQVDAFPTDPEERRVFEALEPIEPGGYFVFVREDHDYYGLTDDLPPGSFYEYGRWFDAVPLSNSSRRLQLAYRAAEFELEAHDAIEWASSKLIDPNGDSTATLPVREDVAWGVHPDHEDPASNDDPAHWCYHADTVGAGVVQASPGAATPSDCSRE